MSAELLKGAPVAAGLLASAGEICARLRESGVVPAAAVVRIGERADDLAYERNIIRRCEGAGIAVTVHALPGDAGQEALFSKLRALSADAATHGILLFHPLPRGFNEAAARARIDPRKDIDGITDASLAGVFTGSGLGFTPCTAQAVMETLAYYGVECAGKRAAVIGRSLVVGRPAAMLLMQEDATVALCHSRTPDLVDITKKADIVVAACGKTESLGPEYFSPGQTVVDVGIGWSEAKGRLCGDVRTDEVSETVGAITPVPGGIGAVTTAVLVLHAAQAAAEQSV